LEIVRRVRAEVPASHALTFKLGLVDMLDNGLRLEESIPRAQRLAAAGVDGIEVSCNLMESYTANVVPYVGVTTGRAVTDLLLHRVLRRAPAEAYYREWCRKLRLHLTIPVIVAGGLRSPATMVAVIESHDADYIALARPFIREPDLVQRIAEGRKGPVACTSCNICVMHDGHHPLQCWRKPRSRLATHALYRLTGGFRSNRGSGLKPRAPSQEE
jgi:2,4-dienoyl-CoA reductase-like NADH-dependent reductase (Old Yellow Enzyme family)